MDNGVLKDLKTKKSKRKKIVFWSVIAIIAIVAFVIFNNKQNKSLVYDTSKIEKGTISSIVSTTGSLSAVTTVDVGSQVSGTIAAIYVDFNDKVKEGQILAKIDPSLYDTQMEKAKAQLDSARAQLDSARADLDKANIGVQEAQSNVYQALANVNKARANLEETKAQLVAARANLRKTKAQLDNDFAEYKRSQELFKRELISQSEKEKAYTTYLVSKAGYESAKAGINSSQANVEASKSSLEATQSTYKTVIKQKESAEASARAASAKILSASSSILQSQGDVAAVQVNLDRCVIRSPIDGVVINRNVEQGQTVAASFNTPVLFTLAKNLKKMEVKAKVDEADIGKIQNKQSVSFTVDAFPEETFKGNIFQVRSSPTTEQNVVTYEVIIRTDNDDLKLKPGMTANIEITVETKSDILRIANSALRFRPDRIDGFPFPPGTKNGKNKSNGSSSRSRGGTIRIGGGGPHGGPRTSENTEPAAKKEESVTIWVVQNNKPHPYKIKTGITDNMYTEIVSGDVKEGMEAITDAVTKKEQAEKAKKRS